MQIGSGVGVGGLLKLLEEGLHGWGGGQVGGGLLFGWKERCFDGLLVNFGGLGGYVEEKVLIHPWPTISK